MSWLFIDTSQAREFQYGLISASKMQVKHVSGRAHALLPRLASSIGIKELQHIDGICVVHGPGSFSSVRGGVIVVNVLARTLKKKLVGVERAEAEDLHELVKQLEAGKKEASAYVMPTYDAEPNITVPKPTT